MCRAGCKPSNTPALNISTNDPIPQAELVVVSRAQFKLSSSTGRGSRSDTTESSITQSQRQGPPQAPAWAACTTGTAETTSYSLELFHKCTMVSYVLPEAFENGADVVADCKLVIELASGSGMFHIWKREQIPKPSHQHSLATPCCLRCDELQAPRETLRDEIQFPFRSRHLTSHYKKQHYTFSNLDPASFQKKKPQKPKHSALFNSALHPTV